MMEKGTSMLISKEAVVKYFRFIKWWYMDTEQLMNKNEKREELQASPRKS